MKMISGHLTISSEASIDQKQYYEGCERLAASVIIVIINSYLITKSIQ